MCTYSMCLWSLKDRCITCICHCSNKENGDLGTSGHWKGVHIGWCPSSTAKARHKQLRWIRLVKCCAEFCCIVMAVISNYNMIWVCDNFLFPGPTPGADEMVGLLVNAGMYDRALTICQLFGMKLTSVFDSLALRYVHFCFSFQYSTLQ